MSRTVTLVLLDAAGRPLGALPPLGVPEPWWQEVHSIVGTVRRRHGLEVAVLRLLDADRPAPPGGHVRYLAQVVDPRAAFLESAVDVPAVPLEPATVDLAPHPLRQPWAEAGGPARSVAWATGELRRLGRRVTAVAQQRTWNLSAIWRLDTDQGPTWLKQLPPFARHEPTVLAFPVGTNSLINGPVVLAADGEGRMLLADVPGEDRYGAGEGERAAVAAEHHAVQLRACGVVGDLVAAGVPDLRGEGLAGWIRERLAGHDVSAAAGLLDGLDRRLWRVGDCGLPDTLVHGDLHPGNVRGDDRHRTVIDWADSFVGHPAFDILRLTEDLDADAAARLVDAWARRWRADVPGSDPRRTVDLLRPVAPLRLAAVYAMFLAAIEPGEHPYHVHDVPAALARAAAVARL
ncbi:MULTISPECIES: aminoglycoside phosphotransferase family protein [unclassified Micromonospora]|uniref:aminoglycoside phosphotransferase family protein n=1 Tax=unclassified Micromonospora TaxID=2617518 RepID=UPI00188F6BFA|nr:MULTISPECIES: aminoglycoside phosphotransferase family protein [unclassified Micromonospora]MBF5029293.1 aminoglycoside phosphotransferase family protein [Micromonospora sp. ANENR4]MCZ7473446.1 aminoglycoside phosphotransferase family protein [Micromonospora sp. WMMC273]WBC04101.1 aminoglycoside phosphotransferase family protein [Micromonospora sp. WMMA1976]